MSSLPKSSGAYAIELGLSEPRPIYVGQLGKFNLPEGIYIYAGSAFGPGGLEARLRRHIRVDSKKVHWHIDYLRQITHIRSYCCASAFESLAGGKPIECSWCQALNLLTGSTIPIAGFGASDCVHACPAHLIHFPYDSFYSKDHRSILTHPEVRSTLAEMIGVQVDELVSVLL